MQDIYFLTKEGALRTGLMIGTKMVESKEYDVYRILSPGERFFKALEAPEGTSYGLCGFTHVTTEDPYSRKVVGPWYVNSVVKYDYDRLPVGTNYKVSHTTLDDTLYLAVCVNDLVAPVNDAKAMEILVGVHDYVNAMKMKGKVIYNDEKFNLVSLKAPLYLSK